MILPYCRCSRGRSRSDNVSDRRFAARGTAISRTFVKSGGSQLLWNRSCS